MEKIKQALERARAAQQGGAQTTAPVTPAPGEPHDSAMEQRITYSQTRVAKIKPSVLRKHRALTGDVNDAALTAFRMLRTQVLQRLVANQWNALAITSPGPGQGKTLTAVNLALSLAREVNYTVLLVDLDLRNPGVHKCFGLKPEYGISDYILHARPLSEILINPDIERLVILPGREAIANSSETLSSPKMVQLVEELKNRYPSRLVLFDLPPILSADDALAFSPYADASLLVIEEGKTSRDELEHAIGLLQGTHLLGTVLNKSHEKITPYY